MTPNGLERDRQLIQHFEDRKARAQGRLHDFGDEQAWCFAVLGLRLAEPTYRFRGGPILRTVVEPPGEVELASAMKDSHLFGAVGRYCHSLQVELVMPLGLHTSPQEALEAAWRLVSGIRVRSLAEILVPAVADHSWSTIAALPNSSCEITLLEDVPRAQRLDPEVVLSSEDIRWVDDNLPAISRLLDVPSFRLAVESLTTHHQHASLRMATAALWSGLEALFQVTVETRFRLAALVSTFIRPRGDDRYTLYSRFKKLYDTRSRVVHGGRILDSEISDHLREVRLVLSEVLCKMIAEGDVPPVDQVESRVFK